MMLCYASQSKPTALKLAEQGIEITRFNTGDINWGKEYADTTLNHDTSNASNKRIMRHLFVCHGVPMPELVLPFTTYPCIGRPDKHTRGKGFWVCYDARDTHRALIGTRTKQRATHFMEYIQNAPHEYRVHVFNGKSIRISEKAFFGREGNHRLYTTIKPTGQIDHVRSAAKLAVEALGLDFGAVDILANDENCWVLEVNSAPSLGGSMPQLYAQAFE